MNDSGFVVLDRSPYSVSYFSQSGDLLTTLGGRGRGPGEIMSIDRVAISPLGYVAVFDLNQFRVIIYNVHTGEYTSIRITNGWNTGLEWVADKLVISNSPFHDLPQKLYIRYYDMSNAQKVDLARIELLPEAGPGEQVECQFCLIRFDSSMNHYMTRLDTTYAVCRVERESGSVKVYIYEGAPPLIRYTEEERETIEAQRNRFAGLVSGEMSPVPDYRPRVMSFSVDGKDRLWVELNVEKGDYPLFDVYSRVGEFLGSVTFAEQNIIRKHSKSQSILVIDFNISMITVTVQGN